MGFEFMIIGIIIWGFINWVIVIIEIFYWYFLGEMVCLKGFEFLIFGFGG